jgi:serine/threonine-protein kinase
LEAAEIGPGDRLGRYQLLVPLAQGGMASVWAARAVDDPARIVAVKMTLTEIADEEESRSMLRDEARNVARIQHANVVEMRDVGDVDDVVYRVMEWVDGESLAVVARAAAKVGPVPIEMACAIVGQVAAGLHAAHELKDEAGAPLELVHRDVSPQNILVGFDGVVKVVDFGVAKASSNMHRTTVGQLKGKASFMAPEQTRGQPVDRRTDVFALGTVLFQLVSGKHPFPGDNDFATMLRIADPKPATLLGAVRADCPPELEAVVATALEKQKEARYGSMLEFARALEAAVPRAPRSPTVVASYVQGLVGARGEKRRDAIRRAIALVDARVPSDAPRVDRARIVKSSSRPPPMGDAPAPDFKAMLADALGPASSGAPASSPRAAPSATATTPGRRPPTSDPLAAPAAPRGELALVIGLAALVCAGVVLLGYLLWLRR